jgi:hypothetical protein
LLAEIISRIYFTTHALKIYSMERIDTRKADDASRAG